MRASVRFVYDYGQLYLYDAELDPSERADAYLGALDAANAGAVSVGTSAGLVDVLMPRQENFRAQLDFAVEAAAPALDAAEDHVVEFDLDVPSGRLVLEGSGGSGTTELAVPPGRYRARLSGRNFDAAAAWAYADPDDPPDTYRLELWPARQASAPAELRVWDGYGRLR